MFGLRKKVERLYFAKSKPRLAKKYEVAHLCGWIAANINNGFWPKGKKLFQKFTAASGTRRVDKNHSLPARVRNFVKDHLCICREELTVCYLIEMGVVSGLGDGAVGNFDAYYIIETPRCRERKESASAVGIYKVTSTAGFGFSDSVAHKGRENKRVVLEKITGLKLKSNLIDLLHSDLITLSEDTI